MVGFLVVFRIELIVKLRWRWFIRDQFGWWFCLWSVLGLRIRLCDEVGVWVGVGILIMLIIRIGQGVRVRDLRSMDFLVFVLVLEIEFFLELPNSVFFLNELVLQGWFQPLNLGIGVIYTSEMVVVFRFRIDLAYVFVGLRCINGG